MVWFDQGLKSKVKFKWLCIGQVRFDFGLTVQFKV